MTSRESLKQPKTPAAHSGAVGHLARASDGFEGPREPIKAYLRIRPAPPGVPMQSYIQVLNDTDVLMVPPADHRLNPSSSTSSLFSNALLRSSNLNLNPSSHPSGVPDDVLASPTPHSHVSAPDPATFGALYKFTSVFPSASCPPSSPTAPTASGSKETGQSQASFFRATTLPLVRDFLQNGENCLLFAYGPTGSGKTFTVQGGAGEERGLLPRVVDVVWKSLEKKRAMPGQFTSPRAPSAGGPVTSTPNAKSADESAPGGSDYVPVDQNYDYSVWVSYSEIYNEKIYDLLEPPLPTPAPSTPAASASSGGGMLKGLFKNFTTVKRSALSLKADKAAPAAGQGTTTKVVGGLQEVKVSTADEGHSVLSRGQSNRRVFSTLANRASSRSHSIFTVKVVRTSRVTGSESTSRFSIVDLAGSERVVHTQTTGDRLREAGNINKSLMVLGQCMEVLRKNQEREKGRKPAIVPFRHSKLTEMFQSFFVGDGKAVMIVNVNPYETGFDENSHVMKFSAVAKGVMTVKRGLDAVVAAVSVPAPSELKALPEVKKNAEPRVVRLSLIEGGEEEEIVYEEEDMSDGEEEDEFVNALLDELSTLRTALYESQLNAELVESNVRAEITKGYEQKMLDMERRFQERLREEAIEAENKLNAKLDILTRLQAAKTPGRGANRKVSLTPSTAYDDSDDGVGGEEEEEEEEEEEQVEKMLLSASRGAETSFAESSSPLAHRTKAIGRDMGDSTHRAASRVLSPLAQEVFGEDDEQQEPADIAGALGQAVDTLEEGAEADGAAQRNVQAAFSAQVGEVEEGGNDDVSIVELATEEDIDDAEVSDDDFVDDDASNGSDADYELSPPPKKPSPIKRIVALDAHGPVSTPKTRADKENKAPDSAASAGTDGAGSDSVDGVDEFGLDKSMVIGSGSKTKKSKRKLGAKVVDVEDIDTYEGVLSPIRKTPSNRNFLY
ncbi:kinesin family member 20/23 [Rhodotorula toruloides]|uniref:Kinesin-like protein n=1 Tax=Rhodotorula toruloides TaxID=5286 RepID=A0A511KE60_RHOTO|nr:kinesin family member 20/23 [Rhodotorula toruloides]